MELTPQQQREQAALIRKHERESLLNQIEMPTRKTGELSKLTKVANTLHVVLQDYDKAENPPAVADAFANLYNETVSRIAELAAAASK